MYVADGATLSTRICSGIYMAVIAHISDVVFTRVLYLYANTVTTPDKHFIAGVSFVY